VNKRAVPKRKLVENEVRECSPEGVT
jgi:hypothetical protein